MRCSRSLGIHRKIGTKSGTLEFSYAIFFSPLQTTVSEIHTLKNDKVTGPFLWGLAFSYDSFLKEKKKKDFLESTCLKCY